MKDQEGKAEAGTLGLPWKHPRKVAILLPRGGRSACPAHSRLHTETDVWTQKSGLCEMTQRVGGDPDDLASVPRTHKGAGAGEN